MKYEEVRGDFSADSRNPRLVFDESFFSEERTFSHLSDDLAEVVFKDDNEVFIWDIVSMQLTVIVQSV